MTGGLSTQVKVNVKPIGTFKSGLIRQVVFERRGLKIQGPLYQILEWKGCAIEVSPLYWGWKRSDGKLMPVLTDLPPAPDELLKMIRCNCRTDCNSMRCTCRKHNLKCSPACGNCKGSACMNSDTFMNEDEDEDEDEVENDE